MQGRWTRTTKKRRKENRKTKWRERQSEKKDKVKRKTKWRERQSLSKTFLLVFMRFIENHSKRDGTYHSCNGYGQTNSTRILLTVLQNVQRFTIRRELKSPNYRSDIDRIRPRETMISLEISSPQSARGIFDLVTFLRRSTHRCPDRTSCTITKSSCFWTIF